MEGGSARRIIPRMSNPIMSYTYGYVYKMCNTLCFWQVQSTRVSTGVDKLCVGYKMSWVKRIGFISIHSWTMEFTTNKKKEVNLLWNGSRFTLNRKMTNGMANLLEMLQQFLSSILSPLGLMVTSLFKTGTTTTTAKKAHIQTIIWRGCHNRLKQLARKSHPISLRLWRFWKRSRQQ